MKRVVVALMCAGIGASSFATPSRVLTMGGHDAFFMDETSIFRNPSNVSIYPNMLMGSYGEFKVMAEDTSGYDGKTAGLKRISRDPRNPYFGGIMSYSLKQSAEEGNQYPMLSVGAVFNRNDPMLKYLHTDANIYGSDLVTDSNGTYLDAALPYGKIDLMAGYAFPNGGMVGLGTYLAFQKKTSNSVIDQQSTLSRGTIGVNWPLAKSMDLEGSIGISNLTLIADDTTTAKGSQVICKNDKTYEGDVRLFSAMTTLNGDVVPHLGIRYMNLASGDISDLNVEGGLGINVNIDKGFFWLGLEALYNQKDKPGTTLSGVGGRIGFGIERNVVWDWFSARVGVQKRIMYVTENEKVGYWEQNPETDAEGDVAALGCGINIENRLKFDFVIAEELQNTFSNLFSGSMHHIITRIDATFSF